MLRLILMRHAKSDWSVAGLDDHDRPLNTRGTASAVALGNWLRTKGYAPEQVLCSSAERTGQTLISLALSPAPQTLFTSALYLAEARIMLETLNAATAPTVLLIGHNPGICELAHRLVDDPPLHERFYDYPTGATLICEFDAATWMDVEYHTGHSVDFVIPRDLMETPA